MSTHTPGPWIADSAGTVRAQCDAQPLPYVVAVVLGDADVGKGRGDANASLIAAAPDLLKALRDLLDWNVAMDPDHDCDEFDAARAAIAKATGVQS